MALIVMLSAAAVSRDVAAAASRVSGARDSSRTVGRVVIDENGVQIEGGPVTVTSGDSADDGGDGNLHLRVGRRHGRRGNVTIGPTGIQVNDNRVGDSDAAADITIDTDDDDVVRVFADAEVGSGERVAGDVVAVFGSVTVRGQVTGNAIAVFGHVELDSTARVEGDAVAIGGVLRAAHGSVVSGQSVSLDFLPISWGMPGLPFMVGAVVMLLLISLLGAWLMQLLFADRLMRAAATASRRTGMSLFLGLASAPLMVIACVLLLITILGIPIALLLPVAYGLLMWAGQLAGTYVLGSKLMRRPLGSPWAFSPLAAGILFVGGFFVAGTLLANGTGFLRPIALFCELVGMLLVIGLTVIGTGAFLISRLGGRPADAPASPQVQPGAAAVVTPN